MPWKEQTVKIMREDFVKRVLAHEKSKSELCREYGISRPTGDKWIKRYQEGEAMNNKSRTPHSIANRSDAEIEKFIVEYRKKYPAIGATKIHRMLRDEGNSNIPCPRTINSIFKRNGLITRQASQAATPTIRFEKEQPNEMWQADFKGNFLIKNGFRCHPLDIVDDCTRFNICCTPLGSETFIEVKQALEPVFAEYGLPFSFLCDNGNPWGTSQSAGFTRFEVWFMELGILTLHGRFLHPQTQGKGERFNGSLTREFLKYTTFENQNDAIEKFAEYRNFYNNKRPHFSLDLDTPAKHYRPSVRRYPDKISEWDYGIGFVLRKVKSTGYFSFNGQGYFLSEAFGDKIIAIRESSKSSSLINLYFRQFIIGQIDIEKRVFTFKRAYLADNDPRFKLSSLR